MQERLRCDASIASAGQYRDTLANLLMSLVNTLRAMFYRHVRGLAPGPTRQPHLETAIHWLLRGLLGRFLKGRFAWFACKVPTPAGSGLVPASAVECFQACVPGRPLRFDHREVGKGRRCAPGLTPPSRRPVGSIRPRAGRDRQDQPSVLTGMYAGLGGCYD